MSTLTTTSQTIANGGSVVYRCDSAQNLYVEPDPTGSGTFDVICPAAGTNVNFTSPASWPSCIYKCIVPSPEPGYLASATSGLVMVNTDITFTCANNKHTIEGTTSNILTVTCGVTGKFPTGWDVCKTQCVVPTTANAMYTLPFTLPTVVVPGNTINLPCATPGHTVIEGTALSSALTLLCDATGNFPNPASWDICALHCAIPLPEAGYLPSLTVIPIAEAATVDYRCSSQYATVTNTGSNITTLTCPPSGILPQGWPICRVECVVPTSIPTGYTLQAGLSTYATQNTVINFNCSDPTHTVVVGTSAMPGFPAACEANGLFPVLGGWPNCTVYCPVPSPADNYMPQSSGTMPQEVAGMLSFQCLSPLATVIEPENETLSSTYNITCQANGTFPSGWPECHTHCLIPLAESTFDNVTMTTPIIEGTSISFPCAVTGAKVGMTHNESYALKCPAGGVLPFGWPKCAVRCIPPLGEQSYNSQPSGADTVPGGGNLTYTCMEPAAYSGTSSNKFHFVQCVNTTGEFEAGWPPCTIRCGIPESESGYNPYSLTGSIAIYDTISYSCTDPAAESGDSQGNMHIITCGSDGQFPTGWPSCKVVAQCNGLPHDGQVNFTLISDQAAGPIKAYRYITYTCNTTGDVFDNGAARFEVPCRIDGSYTPVTTWPTCRPQGNCSDTIPIPPAVNITGLANSTSTVAKALDVAEYNCLSVGWVLPYGFPKFYMQCGLDGTFPSPISWPECVDPLKAFTAAPSGECTCLGDPVLSKAKTKEVIDKLCRNYTITGNNIIVEETAPASNVRCGVIDPNATIAADNFCFCDSPLVQPGICRQNKLYAYQLC
jgi:hypothetical protein